MTDDSDETDNTFEPRSVEEIAEANGVDVDVVCEGIEAMADDDGHRERFASAVGMVACGWESLPEAAERRDVDPADVARALSRHAHREDYDGRLWADRRDDAEIAAARAEELDDDENLEDIDALIDDLPDDVE